MYSLKYKYFIPLFLLIALMFILYFLGFYRALAFETIKYHYNELIEYVNRYPIKTPLMFISVCAASAVLSIPGKPLLNILGGFLFSPLWGSLYSILGMSIGATILFLIARGATQGTFNDILKKPTSFKKIEDGFHKNAPNYMLFLRFFPLLPFWLANLIPAFLNASLRTYIWTTLIGITPKTLIFTHAGKGFNVIFESAKVFSLGSILNTETKATLICLGILPLVPIFFKKRKKL